MEYERIHKVQMGVISPSKLRIKLLGSHGAKRKEGSRNNSSRTSPSKLEDMEYSKNSLLAGDPNEEVSSKANQDASSGDATGSEVPTLELAIKEDFLSCGQDNQTPTFRKDFLPKVTRNVDHSAASQTTLKCVANLSQPAGNSFSTVHPLRSIDEDCYGYDSGHDNASSQSFEFYRGDKTSQHQAVSPFFRNLPSKWNDAEKWIVHRQMMHTASSALKKTSAQSQGSRHVGFGRAVGVPGVTADQKHAEMRRSSSSSSSSNVVEKLALVSNSSQSSLDTTSASSGLTDLSVVTSDHRSVPGIHKELVHSNMSVPENYTTKTAVSQSVQSVSMRDIGTEMTPIPSQEPSRTGTPLDATTPSRSPLSSIPSSPKRGTGAPAPSPIKPTNESKCQRKVGETEVSEREMQLKTRREIAALGLQLGKMNIASWASKNDNGHTSPTKTLDVEQSMNSEYEARAAAWEESQKSRYTSRYKHEEVQIQAWESQQKAKYEAKMRRFEAQVEQMKARAQEKMIEKLASTRRKVEQKHATADAKRMRQAARTSQQVEKIRQTGKIPSSRRCCSWLI